MDDEELELEWEIGDSLRFDAFYPDVDFADSIKEKEYFDIEIYIRNGDEVVGYLVCTVFYDDIIEDSGNDLVTVADDDTTQEIYEAMEIIRKRVEQHTEEETELYLSVPNPSTVYVQNIAVKEGYRNKGIGNWLLRNLPQIITNRYHRDPESIIIKLFPEDINWDETPPRFDLINPDKDKVKSRIPDFFDEIDTWDENDPMFKKMKRLLEKNGYSRYKNSLYFIRDFFME